MNTANQASEDELKERIGNLHAYNYEGDDVTVKVMVDEDILESIAKYVKALIRTEKLKLLAEARERVVDKPTGNHNADSLLERDVLIYNQATACLRTELAKLEANQ